MSGGLTIRRETPEEKLIAEQALVMHRETMSAARGAPHGRGLAAIEQAAVERGREVTRRHVELCLNALADAEKKGEAPPRDAPAAGPPR